jgi:hypothetical protein
LLALGARQIVRISPTGARTVVANAGANQQLVASPDGRFFGIMRLTNELVDSFELRSIEGRPLWAHGARGHHYYQIAPGGQFIVAHSSNHSHPGKPGSVSRITFYDRAGGRAGDAVCARPGASTFSDDGSSLLVECRDSALVLYDARGGRRATLAGTYRNFIATSGGQRVVAVPMNQPASLVIASGAGTPATLQLGGPVRATAAVPNSQLVAVAAGRTISTIDAATGRPVWQVQLEGASALPVSVSAAQNGVVAVGLLVNGDQAMREPAGPHDAAVWLIQGGRVLRRISFQVDKAAAWVPGVNLTRQGARVLVLTPQRSWAVDVAPAATIR